MVSALFCGVVGRVAPRPPHSEFNDTMRWVGNAAGDGTPALPAPRCHLLEKRTARPRVFTRNVSLRLDFLLGIRLGQD